MTREEKYPNTNTFKFFNNNPKNKITSDCVIRAIALAEDKAWQTVLQELADLSIKTGLMINDVKLFEKYLEENNWKKNKQMKKVNNTKYSGNEFCKMFATQTIIANIGTHHTTCIKNGKVHDIWDCTSGAIGNYWTK